MVNKVTFLGFRGQIAPSGSAPVPISNMRLYLSNTCRMSTKDVKNACFHKRKCKCVDEIDQDTSASSASHFKEPGSKRNVTNENKFLSKMKMRKWDEVYIKYVFSSQK